MKASNALSAVLTPKDDKHEGPASAELPSFSVPERIRPEDLERLFATLTSAVPAVVGPDPAVQRQDRLVIQAIYRVVQAAKDYAPANPWDRESPYDVELERVINAKLQASGSKSKVRFQKNTPLETRIARCIYPDRRRAHVASAVIRAAMHEGKAPDELLEFIEQSKGTEAIRRKTSGTTKIDVVKLMWATKPLATISLPEDLIGEQKGELPKTVLCTVRKTGEVDIRWIGDSPATARSALAAYAKQLKSQSVVTPDALR